MKSEKNNENYKLLYETLLGTIPEGFAIFKTLLNFKTKILYFNDEICNITGYTREEIIKRGRKLLCASIPEDFDKVNSIAMKAYANQEKIETTYRTKTKEGNIKYLKLRLTVVNEGNDIAYSYASYTDITEEVKEEERKKELENKLEEEIKYLEAFQSEDLISKIKVNLTKGIVENLKLEGKTINKHTGISCEESINNFKNITANPKTKKYIEDNFSKEIFLKNFKEGKTDYSIDYQRKMPNGSISWVNTKIKAYMNPKTKDILLFIHTYDIDKKNTMQLIVDKISIFEYDFLGLIYLENKNMHSIKKENFEEKFKDIDVINYEEGIERFSNKFIEANEKENFIKSLSIETLKEKLNHSKTYSFTATIDICGKEFYKKWDFIYLDEDKTTIIIIRSDITEIFKSQERQKSILKIALEQAR